MHDPVDIVHETGRVTTVPRGSVNTFARHGWRLASTPEPVDFVDDVEQGFIPARPVVDSEGPLLETYDRVSPRFDSLDES